MTKYILHGGKTTTSTEENRNFFFEMTEAQPDPVTILCIYFARSKSEWQQLFEQDQKHFTSAAPKKIFSFILASTDIEKFKGELEKASVIYMRGGSTNKLIDTLKQCHNFTSLIQGKVVGGSSAGACVLSTHFRSGEKHTDVRQGLGILPIKIYVHYTEEKENEVKELEEFGEQLPLYKIAEGTFIVLRSKL